jgi:hypothetical protein
MDCKHWKDCDIQGGGCCSLGLYGGQPSLGICNRCEKKVELTISAKIKKKIDKIKGKGLGDLIESFTTALGVKKAVETVSKATGTECGCKKRKEALNKALPWKDKENENKDKVLDT